MANNHNILKFNDTVRILSESFGIKKGFVDTDGVFKEATDPTKIKGIRLFGKAITPDQPTRNKVSYSRESLMASYKTLIGKPFLDSHKDDSIRTHPPFGHVVNAYMTDEGLMYEVDIDPAEEVFIRKVERGDIKGVSIQVLVSDVEQREGYVRAHVQEFLELSSVLIPGDGDTSMRLMEAFNMNKKEDVDVNPLDLEIKQSGDTPLNISKPKIQKPEFNQVLNKWIVQYEGETLKFDNEESANAFYNVMTKFQDSSPTDKKTEPAFDTVDMMKKESLDDETTGGAGAKHLEEQAGWERPPKGWFYNCVDKAKGFADNPEAYCNWLWNEGPEEQRKSMGKEKITSKELLKVMKTLKEYKESFEDSDRTFKESIARVNIQLEGNEEVDDVSFSKMSNTATVKLKNSRRYISQSAGNRAGTISASINNGIGKITVDVNNMKASKIKNYGSNFWDILYYDTVYIERGKPIAQLHLSWDKKHITAELLEGSSIMAEKFEDLDALYDEKAVMKEVTGGSGAKHLGIKAGDKTIPPSNSRPDVKHDIDEEYDNLPKIPSKPQDRDTSDYPPKDLSKKGWTQGCPWCGSKNWRRMSPSEFEIVGLGIDGEELEGEEEGTGYYYCRNCGTIFEVEDGRITDIGKPELRKVSDEKPYLNYVKGKEDFTPEEKDLFRKYHMSDKDIKELEDLITYIKTKYKVSEIEARNILNKASGYSLFNLPSDLALAKKLIDRVMQKGKEENFILKAECLNCGYRSHIDNFPDEMGELFCPKCQEKDIKTIKE